MNDPGRIKSSRLGFSLLPKAEGHLNRRVRRHGDVSRLVEEALRGVDLRSIPIEPRPKHRGVTKAKLRARQALIDSKLADDVHAIAQERGVSLNTLVDAAINAHFDARSSKPSPPEGDN